MLISGYRVVSPSSDSWRGLIPRMFVKYGLNTKVQLRTETPYPPEGLHSFEVYLVIPESVKEWWKTPSDLYKIFPIQIPDYTKIPTMESEGFKKLAIGVPSLIPKGGMTLLNDTEIIRRWATDSLNEPAVESNSDVLEEVNAFQRLCCRRTYEYYSSRLQDNIDKWNAEIERVNDLDTTISPGLASSRLEIHIVLASFLGIPRETNLIEVYNAWISKAQEELEYSYNRIAELVSGTTNNTSFTLRNSQFLQNLRYPINKTPREFFRFDVPSPEQYRGNPELGLFVRRIDQTLSSFPQYRFFDLVVYNRQNYDPAWDHYAGDAVGWYPYYNANRVLADDYLAGREMYDASFADQLNNQRKGIIPQGTSFDILGVTFIDYYSSSRFIPDLPYTTEHYALTSSVIGNNLYQLQYEPVPSLWYPNYRSRQIVPTITPSGQPYLGYESYVGYPLFGMLNDFYLARLNLSDPDEIYAVRGAGTFNESSDLIHHEWVASDASPGTVRTIPGPDDIFTIIASLGESDHYETDGNVTTVFLEGREVLFREGGDGPDFTYTPFTLYEKKRVYTFLGDTYDVKTYLADYSSIPIDQNIITRFDWEFESHTIYNLSEIFNAQGE